MDLLMYIEYKSVVQCFKKWYVNTIIINNSNIDFGQNINKIKGMSANCMHTCRITNCLIISFIYMLYLY